MTLKSIMLAYARLYNSVEERNFLLAGKANGLVCETNPSLQHLFY